MKSNNITDTQSRLGNILNNITNNAIESTVPNQISNALKDVHIQTGVITRYYLYIDKVKVKLDSTGELMLCKILHQYGGDIMNLYTPTSQEYAFDKVLNEPYIVPKGLLHVCVLKIQDSDSQENLILGYYQNEEIVGYNPAKPGNIKLVNLRETGDEYWIKFGIDGFQYKLPQIPNRKVGSVHENGFEEVDYVNSGECYSKEEVDNLLLAYEERIVFLEEKLRELTGETNDNTDENTNINNNTVTDNDNGEGVNG